MDRKNVVLTDFVWDDNKSEFMISLNKFNKLGRKWESLGLPFDMHLGKLRSRLRWFSFCWGVFRHIKEWNEILAWQQFFGIILASYCRIFHVRKTFRIHVMTFIYKERSGFLGHVFKRCIRYAIESRYVDSLIVFGGEKEVEYYRQCFPTCSDKFVALPLGISKIKGLGAVNDKDFILAAGRSNRDYEFLIDALENTTYRVLILTDEPLNHVLPDNIKLMTNVGLPKMFDYLNVAKCVVIPLKNSHISSGQLFFLQAMQLRKPVIVTENDTLGVYIEHEQNGLIIPKTREALLDALERLDTDKELHERLTEIGYKRYCEQFSEGSMARNIIEKVIMRKSMRYTELPS